MNVCCCFGCMTLFIHLVPVQFRNSSLKLLSYILTSIFIVTDVNLNPPSVAMWHCLAKISISILFKKGS